MYPKYVKRDEVFDRLKDFIPADEAEQLVSDLVEEIQVNDAESLYDWVEANPRYKFGLGVAVKLAGREIDPRVENQWEGL